MFLNYPTAREERLLSKRCVARLRNSWRSRCRAQEPRKTSLTRAIKVQASTTKYSPETPSRLEVERAEMAANATKVINRPNTNHGNTSTRAKAEPAARWECLLDTPVHIPTQLRVIRSAT